MPDLRQTSSPKLAPQTGAGRFSFLLLLALTAAVVYLVWAFVPPYLGKQRMEEAATEIVHRGATQNLGEADVRAQLHEKARELGLPEKYQLEISRQGRAMTARIAYTHSVWFPFYTYPWNVEIEVKDLGF